MHAYVINSNGSSTNLPSYPLESHQFQNAIYWTSGRYSMNLTWKDCSSAISYWTL